MKKIKTATVDLYSQNVIAGDVVACYEDGQVYHVDSVIDGIMSLSQRAGNVYVDGQLVADVPLVHIEGWY